MLGAAGFGVKLCKYTRSRKVKYAVHWSRSATQLAVIP